MNNEKTIEALNTLITINNDRIDGYDTASAESEQQDLIALFDGFRKTSQKFKLELSDEVRKLGGTPSESTNTSGKLFRIWMEIKTAFTDNDRIAILNSCEYGEDALLETYAEVLKDKSEHLSTSLQNMVKAQCDRMKIDHDKVISMRDSIAEAQ